MTQLFRVAAAVALILCPSLLVRAQEKKEAGTPHVSAAPKHHSLQRLPRRCSGAGLIPKRSPNSPSILAMPFLSRP